MKISDVMKVRAEDIVTAPLGSTVLEVAEILSQNKVAMVVVMDQRGTPRGIFSERDIINALATRGKEAVDLIIDDLVTRDLMACSPDAGIEKVLHMMNEGHFRHVPVVEVGRLKGLVSIVDILRHLVEQSAVEHREEMWEKLDWL